MKATAMAVLLALGLGVANADTTPPSRELVVDYLNVSGLPQIFEGMSADLSQAIKAKAMPEQAETMRQSLSLTMSWSALEGDSSH